MKKHLTQKQLDALKLGRMKGKNMTRPKGLVYVKHKDNPTSFKKGLIPWNKGKTGLQKGWNAGTKGIMKPNKTSFTKETSSGELNNKWKGNLVGYFSLHTWLTRNFGKPQECEYCGEKKNIQWASKNYSYDRARDSWLHLCVRCHRRYDRDNGYGLAVKKFPELVGARRRNV